MSWKINYLYHVTDEYETDFIVVVEDIESRGRYPVRTKVISSKNSKHESYGDGWSLNKEEDIIEIGHIKDYPEYFL